MEQTAQTLIASGNHRALLAALFAATAIAVRLGILVGSLPGA